MSELSEVKVEEGTERWDSAECPKEEPHMCIKQEEGCSFPYVTVNLQRLRPAASNREETEAEDRGADSEEDQLKGEAGCSSYCEIDVYIDQDSDGCSTDHSEDWDQEPTQSKRSYAMIPPDSTVSDGRETPYSCSECGEGVKWKVQLNKHLFIHPGLKPYRCSVCDKCFKLERYLQCHMMSHTEEKSYRCSVCEKQFRRQYYLKKHMKIHSEERPYKCDTCEKCFRQKAHAENHMRSHTGERPFKCSVCDKSFNHSSCLPRHMRIHSMVRPNLKCSVCKKYFKTTEMLEKHSHIHEGQKSNVTEGLVTMSLEEEVHSENSNSSMNLSAEQTEHHVRASDSTTESIRNAEVDRSPETRTSTARTVKPDSMSDGGGNGKPYSCSECEWRFVNSNQFKQHMMTHTGQRPYKCSICMKAFGKKFDLKTHMWIHTGEKPFRCSVCNTRFVRQFNLDMHMTRHTGKKPYICSVCDQSLKKKHDLRKHMKIHPKDCNSSVRDKAEEIKPYSCPDCGKAFRWITYLQRHEVSHTRKKPYSCSECGKAFGWFSCLWRHKNKVHQK